MAGWFKTKKQADDELKDRKSKNAMCMDEVWKWRHTKRKKPFFVGSHIEWINK